MPRGHICNPPCDLAALPDFGPVCQQIAPRAFAARAEKGDWILCQITSNPYADRGADLLAEQDFSEGGLQRDSYARPNKLFTAHETLFQRAVGQLGAQRHAQVVSVIVELLRAGG